MILDGSELQIFDKEKKSIFPTQGISVPEKMFDDKTRSSIEGWECEGIIQGFLSQVEKEYINARVMFPIFVSGHEGYGVTLEELDEFWELIKKTKDSKRMPVEARKECVQVAAMMLGFYLEVT